MIYIVYISLAYINVDNYVQLLYNHTLKCLLDVHAAVYSIHSYHCRDADGMSGKML